MAEKGYRVHGIDCTTSERKTLTTGTIEEAYRELEDWYGWFVHLGKVRKLEGSSEDFYVENALTVDKVMEIESLHELKERSIVKATSDRMRDIFCAEAIAIEKVMTILGIEW